MESEFVKWNNLKIELNKTNIKLYPKVREIWYVSVGVNIGTEIYGKGHLYLRPVLVINCDNPRGFIGLPLTSKIKRRKYTETIKTVDGRTHNVLIYQIRVFDNKRLVRKKYFLDKVQYQNIKNIFDSIYKIQ